MDRRSALGLGVWLAIVLGAAAAWGQAAYDIVYVRAPRYGDETNTRWAEVKDPINMEPGSDLMLIRPDGSEEVLVAGGDGAIVDPYVSFDGEWVYYAKFHDLRSSALNGQRRDASRAGSDIYKIELSTRQVVQLTFQEWTPNTGITNWSADHLSSSGAGTYYLGYGIFNLGPCPLPDGRVIFTSSRNGFMPNKSFTFPNLQLFVMDEDGGNVEQIGHMNLGSALHPTVLTDGRVLFSSYEAQGLRDRRLWALWSIWPDGRSWRPHMSAFSDAAAFHFQTELSNRDIAVVEYYNQNNNGFGTVLAFPPAPPAGVPAFGSPAASHASNPAVERGIWFFDPSHPSHLQPRYKSYPFSPYGIYSLSAFSHGEDNASSRDLGGGWAGKVTHPSGAPNNDVLLVWTPGPANDLNRPTNQPRYDGGIYVLAGGVPVNDPNELLLVKNDPSFNEMQPRAVVPYSEIYGIEAPAALPWLPNDGSAHPELGEGTPFGLVGTSSFYKRDTTPGSGEARFDGLDPFNTSENGASSNWGTQGADAGKYDNSDIYAVRVLAMEPTSHLSYGPGIGNGRIFGYFNHATERLRILGEIPLRKSSGGSTLLDVDGNPDTSFLAKIPADVPFTFQTLDRDGLALNTSQTWHQVRPGEARTDCGGCHAHSQLGTDFSTTAAAQPGYAIADLATTTPLLTKDASGLTSVATSATGAVDVEYYRDIKPILQRSCVACHSGASAAAELVLDDTSIVNGYENTYNRLARDADADFGIPPVISNGAWRQTNASRYIRPFQSRRSLLIWKLFGRRLDGWLNSDHPTESVPGDASTLPAGANANDADLDFIGEMMPPPSSGAPPLSEDEKMMFARWVDLGAPITSQDSVLGTFGWFADDLRPTLTVSAPRVGRNDGPLDAIRIGAFDYYSGLEPGSLSVVADFDIHQTPAGTELAAAFTERDHVWTMDISPALESLPAGEIVVRVKDVRGNWTEIRRRFSIDDDGSPPENEAPVVSAGADSSVELPGAATLAGVVTDDGLPSPPGVLSTQWSVLTSAGPVSIADPSSPATMATFSIPGIYDFRLTADDGAEVRFDDVRVTVTQAPPVNEAPLVDAGPDRQAKVAVPLALSGTAVDDGLPVPPGALSLEWSKVEGPGDVAIAEPNRIATELRFDAPGEYRIRLSASDGDLTASDDLMVEVERDGGPPTRTLTLQVDDGSDDAVQNPFGRVNLEQRVLALYRGALAGLRFADVDLPRGARIESAHLELTSGLGTSRDAQLEIAGEAVDDAPPIRSQFLHLLFRRVFRATEHHALWQSGPWRRLETYPSADLSAIVQEIVDRDGWFPGGSMLFFVTPRPGTSRWAVAYDGSAELAPKLVIQWSEAEPETDARPSGEVN